MTNLKQTQGQGEQADANQGSTLVPPTMQIVDERSTALWRAAKDANLKAMGLEIQGRQNGWTFDLHAAAVALHAKASEAYSTLTCGVGEVSPQQSEFIEKQALAHHAAMERHVVGLYESVAPELWGATKMGAIKKLCSMRESLRDGMPSWLATSLGESVFGGWVSLAVKPNGDLQICLTEEGKAHEDDWRGKTSDESLWNLTEDLVGNGKMGWLQPEEIGALTDAPILALGIVSRNDKGELEAGPSVYWHERYQVDDPIEEMLTAGEVIFKGSRSELVPELAEPIDQG